MTKSHFTIKDVLKKNICIGCGACSIITNGKVGIEKSRHGIYTANLSDINKLDETNLAAANSVCPFSDLSENEDKLGAPQLDSKNLPYEPVIGNYHAAFAGRQADDKHVMGSSSGGLTSWVVTELFDKNKIDAVIHVGASEKSKDLFDYCISYSAEQVRDKRKSFYYSTTMSEVFDKVRENIDIRYAIIGVPCFIKSVRLLAQNDAELKSCIKYFLGLVCGHMKSAFFAQSMAWQAGAMPEELQSIDFRVKIPNKRASRYNLIATSTDLKHVSKPTSSLMGGNWGHAFFQPNACNYCDDVFAETADIVFGDAWLPRYINDWRGTNIVVSRNPELTELLKSGNELGKLNLDDLSIADALKSQAGGIRHRRIGLSSRLADDAFYNIKAPIKRVSADYERSNDMRGELVRQRKKMSRLSLETFRSALETSDLKLFTGPMQREIDIYKYINDHSYPPVKNKKKYYDVALFGWHNQANLGGVLTFLCLHQLIEYNGLSVVVVRKPGKDKIDESNQKNYNITKTYFSYTKYRPVEKLNELRHHCDTFVMASDQLWAGKWIPFHPEYEFLGCGDKSVKKISVATSFGGHEAKLPFDGEKANIVSYLLGSFDYLSVREELGVDILKSIGLNSTQILDPVFLAPRSFYDELIEKSTFSFTQNFVIGYLLDPDSDILGFSNEVKIKLGLEKLRFLTTGINKDRVSKFEGFDLFYNADLSDFVKSISQSEFLITDSFHGACMAVIFNKPFLCCPKGSRGNSRFQIFSKLGLGNRIVTKDKLNDSIYLLNEPIDWTSIESKLYELRRFSFSWLSQAFEKEIKGWS
ncbi:Coenzyme F420 hydrogenase/dehydrogenase, beta subunit C-terminal domain [Vreelandella sp. TE19]